tara:strand:- start:2086 stop:2814 length:729 start_codon:yes stop_codon:yes gene_type:complete
MIQLIVLVCILIGAPTWAEPANILFDAGQTLIDTSALSSSVNLLLILTSIGFVPAFLMVTTSFLRFVIVLSMIRQALGTAQSPPNPVIVILALFMTAYVMAPVITTVYETAIVPYNNGAITQKEAFSIGTEPFHAFMLKQVNDGDVGLFLEFSNRDVQADEKIPLYVLIPAFIISELKSAFQIAFLIYLPFVVVDLLISNILLTLGMFMLSPAMVSMPFKFLLFILVDGWNLIVRGLLLSYQ